MCPEQLTLQLDSAERSVHSGSNIWPGINQPNAKHSIHLVQHTVLLAVLQRVLQAGVTEGMVRTCAQPQFNPLSATETPPFTNKNDPAAWHSGILTD